MKIERNCIFFRNLRLFIIKLTGRGMQAPRPFSSKNQEESIMRIPRQEITDPEIIRQFLSDNKFFFVTVPDTEYPYTVPFNIGYRFDDNGELTFYFHASVGGRFYEIMHREENRQGVNASFAMALMDGYMPSVLGWCWWDASYRSILGEGRLSIVDDPEEKQEALGVLMDSFGAKRPAEGYDFPTIGKVIVYQLKVHDFHMKKSKQDFRSPDRQGFNAY